MPDAQPTATSLTAYGEPTAPAANAALATIADPPDGMYEIECWVTFVGAAPTVSEDGNVEIREGATVLGRIATGRAQNTQYYGRLTAVIDGTNAITANANAAGTAAVLYVTSLVATLLRTAV
jgi:hypothetical protein